MTDHGNVFGAYEFYKKCTAAGVKPIIGMEAYFTPNISRYERKRVNFYKGGPDDVSSRGAYTHMTLLSETTEGMHNLFRLSTGAWRDGFFQHPRADRELLSAARRRHHRHHRLPLGRDPGPPAPRQLRGGPPDRRGLPGDPGPRQLLPRADGPRPRHRAPGPRRPAQAGQGPPDPAAGHQRLALRPPGGREEPGAPALHQLRLDDGHPGRRRSRASGSPSPATATTSSRPPRCARCGSTSTTSREACDNTLWIAERCDVAFTEGNGTYMPRSPAPRGRTRTPGWSRRSSAACRALPGRACPTTVRKQAEFEVGVITRWASPATSSSSPTSSTGPRTTASASARAVARVPARWSPTPCGSPTSTRSSTA